MQIKIENVNFKYSNTLILEDINLEIDRGEYIAIIGPNGGGKTTFVKLLLGLLSPSSGKIKIFEKPAKEAREKIGYLPQYINFNMDMPIRVLDIVLQGRLNPRKLFYSKEDYSIANQQLESMNISHLSERKIKDLSGGQRQRVLLARALAREPEILILDEPTASIDLEGQKEIYKLLDKLPLTKLIISHDINILFENITKVAHINKKLFLHEDIKHNISREDGHFCEMELLETLRREGV